MKPAKMHWKQRRLRRRISVLLAVVVVIVATGTAWALFGVEGSLTAAIGNRLPVGPKCRHNATGEVLTEVRDVAGKTWSVQKFEVTALDMTVTACGVPIAAQPDKVMSSQPSFLHNEWLYHPDGTEIKVTKPARGFYLLEQYGWY